MTLNNTIQCRENEENEDLDTDPKHVRQMYEDVDLKDGLQGDKSSRLPPHHPDMQDPREKTCSERAAEMWNVAKSGRACRLIIPCCVLVVVVSVVIAIIVFACIKPGSERARGSTNQDGTLDPVKLTNSCVPMSWHFYQENSSALANSASFSPPSRLEITTPPRMLLEENNSNVAIANSFLPLPKKKESAPPTSTTFKKEHHPTAAHVPSKEASTELPTSISGHLSTGIQPFTTMSPSTTVTRTPQCESGWIEYNNYCYNLMGDKVKWYTAASQCEQHGARLASIRSPEENKFITGLISNAPGKAVWIGLHKYGSVWKWTDGTQLTYSNWKPGEPNNEIQLSKIYSHGGNEECVSVYSKTSKRNWFTRRQETTRGQWNDAHCLCDLPYICKKLKR